MREDKQEKSLKSCSRILLAAIVTCAIFTGCNGAFEHRVEQTSTETQITEMTEKEKDFLANVYPGEERIWEGRLFDYQKAGLSELRAGLQYLEEKYPDQTFDISWFEPSNVYRPAAVLTLTVSRPGLEEEYYYVRVRENENGYICTDDYYTVLLQENADTAIKNALAEAGIATEVRSRFIMPAGKEMNGSTSVEEALQNGDTLLLMSWIYSTNADLDAGLQVAQAVLEEKGWHGTYILAYVPDLAVVRDSAKAPRNVEHRELHLFREYESRKDE